jgi:hypothetical protein
MWHPIEMYDDKISLKAIARNRHMQVRDVEDADGEHLGTEIKINTVWQPTWWITLDEKDELVSVSKIYGQMRKTERKFKKKNKHTPHDYTNRGPKKHHPNDTKLDAYREKRKRGEVEDDFERLMGHDMYERATNEEIESED